MAFGIEEYERVVGRLDVDDLDFTAFAREPLAPAHLRCLRYMHDVEHHTTCYLRNLLNTRAHDDPDVTAFTAIIQVGAVLATLLYLRMDIIRIIAAWFGGRMGAVEPTITARMGLGSAATSTVVERTPGAGRPTTTSTGTGDDRPPRT